MTAFDKIIGYDSIKNKLIKICDMLKNNKKGSKPFQCNHGIAKRILKNLCYINFLYLPCKTVDILINNTPDLGTLNSKIFIYKTAASIYR